MRRFLRLLVAAIAIAVLPGVPAQAATLTAHQPVLFVHGYNSNASTWNAMLAAFRDVGYTDEELFAISYDYNQSNVTTAQQLQVKVDEIRQQTGWASVDIISHSMLTVFALLPEEPRRSEPGGRLGVVGRCQPWDQHGPILQRGQLP